MGSLDEIRMYEAQIKEIEEQIAHGDDDTALVQAREDILELLTLLKSELVEDSQDSPDLSTSAESSIDEQDFDFDEELLGMRIGAPFRNLSLIPKLHSAIVMDVLPPTDERGILLRILYSMPVVAAMKPCSHFLSGNCRFDERCKFSHGEIIPLREVEEYEQPDFCSMGEGSLVLVRTEDGLWAAGRIKSRDDKESAVSLLSTGKEISAQNDAVIPLMDPVDENPSTSSSELLPDDRWTELKSDICGDITVGDLGNWNGGGFGLKLMQKMGFRLGQGLGKNSDGIVHAVQAKIYPKSRGLDVGLEKTVIEKKDKRRKTLAKHIGKLKEISMLDVDIFSFINRKLGDDAKDETTKYQEESKKMKIFSEKSLGIRGIEVESELKQLRSKEKRLTEGIQRNGKDEKTCSRLKINLAALQKDITRLERSHAGVHKEMANRMSKKRDVF